MRKHSSDGHFRDMETELQEVDLHVQSPVASK